VTGAQVAALGAAVVALLLSLLLGTALVRVLGGGALVASLGRAGEGALGLGAGVTVVSLLLGSAYAAGLPAPGAWTAGAALLLAASLAWRARRIAPAGGACPCDPPPARIARAGRVAGWLALLALLAVTGALAWRTAAGFPDAHDVWLLRGKVLYLDGGFGGAYFGEWRQAHDNRSYPPLVSLASAWIHEVARGVDDRAVKLLSVAWLVALVALAFAALRRVLGHGLALALALALAGCTTGTLVAIWGIADLPLALHVLSAGVLLLALDDRRALARLLPLPLLGAVLTKNEGLPVALAVAAAAALRFAGEDVAARGAWTRCGAAATRAALLLLPAALALGAWWAWTRSLDLPLQFTLPSEEGGLQLGRLDRLGLVLREAGARLAEPSWLAGWCACGLVVTWMAWRRLARQPAPGFNEAETRAWYAAVVLLLAAGAYAAVLSGYRGNLAYLLPMSTSRLLYQLYPLALVLGATVVGRVGANPPPAGSRSPPAPRAARRPSSP